MEEVGEMGSKQPFKLLYTNHTGGPGIDDMIIPQDSVVIIRVLPVWPYLPGAMELRRHVPPGAHGAIDPAEFWLTRDASASEFWIERDGLLPEVATLSFSGDSSPGGPLELCKAAAMMVARGTRAANRASRDPSPAEAHRALFGDRACDGRTTSRTALRRTLLPAQHHRMLFSNMLVLAMPQLVSLSVPQSRMLAERADGFESLGPTSFGSKQRKAPVRCALMVALRGWLARETRGRWRDCSRWLEAKASGLRWRARTRWRPRSSATKTRRRARRSRRCPRKWCP